MKDRGLKLLQKVSLKIVRRYKMFFFALFYGALFSKVIENFRRSLHAFLVTACT